MNFNENSFVNQNKCARFGFAIVYKLQGTDALDNEKIKSESDFHILVIDDDNAIRDCITYALSLEGFKVHGATHGQAGLEFIHQMKDKALPIDLIFLDLMMPKMNGWEFLANASQDAFLKDTKIILITAAGNIQPTEGLTAVLNKPFELDALIEIAKKHTLNSSTHLKPPTKDAVAAL